MRAQTTTTPEHGPALISAGEAATRLGVSLRNVWSLIAAGAIPAVRVSPRATRIDPRDLERFIAARRREG